MKLQNPRYKQIARAIKKFYYRRKVDNYFSSQSTKRVLIAYVVAPFVRKDTHVHTSYAESMAIAKIFNDLGFAVDIVNHDYGKSVDYEQYDVIFGFGPVLNNSFYHPTKPDVLRIYYGTGTHPYVSNQRCLGRLRDVYEKKGAYILESVRLIDEDYALQTMLVDAMIIIGNDRIVESYRQFFKGPIHKVPVSYYPVCDSAEIIENKHFAEAKKNFLFFSSSGMIHRGLDLLLDYFSRKPDLHLHICSPLDAEPAFKEAYRQELSAGNIHDHGFINLKSTVFKELVQQCAFTVLPSCSEGQPGGIVNLMGNAGLIPLLSKEAGCDLADFGLMIRDFSEESVSETIAQAVSISDTELNRLSKLSADYAQQHNSLNTFSGEFKKALEAIIKH